MYTFSVECTRRACLYLRCGSWRVHPSKELADIELSPHDWNYFASMRVRCPPG